MRLLVWTIAVDRGDLIAPAQAQTYAPGFPVCLQTYGITGNASIAATPRWISARRQRRAARRNASAIRILRRGPARRRGRFY